jgi:hypothetical protein
MPSHYSRERIDEGLSALVITGSETRASELTGIPKQTIHNWERSQAKRMEELRHELEPQVAKQIAATAEHLTQRSFQVQAKILDRFDDDTISELKPADMAGALRNLQTHAALGIDKLSSPLRQRPSHMQHHLNVVDLVTQLSSRLGFDATSTAVEIPNEAVQIPLSGHTGTSNAHE